MFAPLATRRAALSALLVFAATPAIAAPVYLVNDLDAPSIGDGLAVRPGATAFASFTTNDGGNLAAIAVLLAGRGEVPAASLGFGLYADAGNAPGGLLRRLAAGQPAAIGPAFTPVVLTGVDHVRLQPVTRYWIGITAPTVEVRWATTADLSRTGATGEFSVSEGALARNAPGHPAPQMQVRIDVYEPPPRINPRASISDRPRAAEG